MKCLLIASLVLLTACAPAATPEVECALPRVCHETVTAALQAMPDAPERLVISTGRSPGRFHAEAHGCYADGRYVLVDVWDAEGGGLAGVPREFGWRDPPCDED